MRPKDVNSLRHAGVVLTVLVAALTACDPGEPPERPIGAPTKSDLSGVVVQPRPAAMPEVPMRFMYARGADHEGVLVSAAGITETGQTASAYVATRTGAVFASGDVVYDLADGGDPVAVGPVDEQDVYLQADPTLRYVTWKVRQTRGRRARVLVYDVVAQRTVLDRALLWGDRTRHLRIASFDAARLRLVHLPESGFWTFATVSGRALALPGGQVVDLRTRRVAGPRVSRGLRSPGLRYRVSDPRGRRPWQVVDLTTGQDVTPASLLRPGARAAHLTGWLGNETFGVLASSGTWRHSTIAASVCRVGGRCRVMWRHDLGVSDGGLQQSNEIG